MAVGAGLRLGGLKAAPALAATFLTIRQAVLPVVAIGLTAALALLAEQRKVVALFAALPTASSAHVLAARRGGDGSCVAGLVTGCRPRALLPKTACTPPVRAVGGDAAAFQVLTADTGCAP